jgi:hypothetical protein
MMSFKFDKQNKQGKRNDEVTSLDYSAGQYAYFDIGGERAKRRLCTRT